MTKEISTGKARLLFVKLPYDSAFDFSIEEERLYYWYTFEGYDALDFLHIVKGNWSDPVRVEEVTEDVAHPIVNDGVEWEYPEYGDPYAIQLYYGGHDTAKDAFEELLQANEIYTVNPLSPPIERLQYGGEYSTRQSEVDEWQQAEESTGSWVMLIERA